MQDVMTMNTAKEFAEVDMPGNNSTVLKGSCLCGKCRLEAISDTPYPFMVNTVTRGCMASCRLMMNKPTAPDYDPFERCNALLQVCHCISCRKTGGAYCVYLAAEKESLKVEGREHVKSYR